MKILCFIFSFYLLFLSVQPCQDLAKASYLQAETENEQANFQAHEEDEEDCKEHECSPFCICSCRQISLMYNFSPAPIQPETGVFTKNFPRIFSQQNYHHLPLDSIWQPPKSDFTA